MMTPSLVRSYEYEYYARKSIRAASRMYPYSYSNSYDTTQHQYPSTILVVSIRTSTTSSLESARI
eukprot:scaffold600797_cov20-Prasinocladus_malaysianus.AAC.1